MDDRLAAVKRALLGGAARARGKTVRNMTAALDPRRAELAVLLDERRSRPVDNRELASLVRFDEALGRLERPFDTSADLTHVTSSALVTGPAGIVLLLHKRMRIWLQPGGHLDPGEDLAAAALREATEETGLVLAHPPGGPSMVHVDVHAGGRGHTHLDLRWLLHGQGEPCPPAGESPDVAWFDWSSAALIADPGLAGILGVLRPDSSAPTPQR